MGRANGKNLNFQLPQQKCFPDQMNCCVKLDFFLCFIFVAELGISRKLISRISLLLKISKFFEFRGKGKFSLMIWKIKKKNKNIILNELLKCLSRALQAAIWLNIVCHLNIYRTLCGLRRHKPLSKLIALSFNEAAQLSQQNTS